MANALKNIIEQIPPGPIAIAEWMPAPERGVFQDTSGWAASAWSNFVASGTMGDSTRCVRTSTGQRRRAIAMWPRKRAAGYMPDYDNPLELWGDLYGGAVDGPNLE